MNLPLNGFKKTFLGICSFSLVAAMGCGSVSSLTTSSLGGGTQDLSGAPTTATMVYLRGNYLSPYFYSIVGFTPTGNGADPTPTMTLNLPSSLVPSVITTDAAGKIYVSAAPQDAASYQKNGVGGEILIYGADATGNAAPQRVITPSLFNMVVDATGQIYGTAADASGNWSVLVYSATANGATTPLRTISLGTGGATDISLDAAGNIYVNQNNSPERILVFASGASTPTRTISTSGVLGMKVNSAGNLYTATSDSTGDLYIKKYAVGATDLSAPLNTIHVPLPEGTLAEGPGSPLSLDADGNMYLGQSYYDNSLVLSPTFQRVYGFHANATGDAASFFMLQPTTIYNAPVAVN